MTEKREHVISTNLENVMADEGHLYLVRDAVERVHRITIDATELLSLHLTRCLEEGLSVPIVDANYMKVVMMEVSRSGGEDKRRRVDDALAETRTRFMPELGRVDRSKLDQMLMAQSISLHASFNTNLGLHFRKRVSRYVKLHFPRPEERLSSEEHRKRKLQLMRIASDLCKPVDVEWESDADHHPWIGSQRERLGLTELRKWAMEEVVKTQQSTLLRASWLMNRELEDAGKRCFSISPLRRQMRPAFCPIDTVAIRNLLTLDASYANKQAQLRTEKQKVVCERRERIASAREQAGLPKTMVDDFDPSRWSLPCDALGACPEIQRHVRGWLGRRKAAKRRHAFTLQRAKTESWSEVLHLDKKVKIAKGYQFAGSIRTDGVSVRLLFDKAQTAASGTSHSKKRKRATDQPKEVKTNREGLPRPGLYTMSRGTPPDARWTEPASGRSPPPAWSVGTGSSPGRRRPSRPRAPGVPSPPLRSERGDVARVRSRPPRLAPSSGRGRLPLAPTASRTAYRLAPLFAYRTAPSFPPTVEPFA